MRRIHLWSSGVLPAVFLVTFLLLVRDSAACDCKPPPAPKEALEKSAAVFVAKVVKIEDDPVSARGRKVHVEVEKWWKGGDTATLIVSTAKSGATCGYGFREGGRYLVYAYGEKGKNEPLLVSLCSRTRTLEQAETSGDFKELGDGKPPVGKR